ncbi:MFS transporter [Paractinoplanes deccanensis]|uniref:MFS transporter n=1 Tax=Paractinoplanes deccanensis TaxID=113561 RepID=A0ABQ3Y350_9ACTN|nr:MFS transporter [Actinoplanes deccanensis]GID74426.1 MFS transporter [Actinoplanes deccanensis]
MTATTTQTPAPAVADARHSRATLVLVLLSVAAVSYALVLSLVNPALEALRGYLHTDQVGVTWVLTAFLLSSAVFTPVLGRLGDHLGKRRVLLVIMVLLTVGSIIAALAHSLPLLLVGRVIQGAGGATLPLAFGIVRDLLPRQRVGSAVGTIAAVSAVGGALGVLITGPIIDHLGIPWLFWLPAIANGLVALVMLRFIPHSPRGNTGPGDLLAGASLAVTLVLLLLPLSLGGDWGWGSPRTIGSFVLAVIFGAVWVWVESRSQSPLIDMRVFRLRPVWTANLASLLFGITLYSAFGFIPAFLQTPTSTGYGLGESITVSGLLFVPVTVAQFVFGVVAGPLANRIPAKAVLVIGAIPVIVAFGLLTFAHDEVWQIILATVLAGIGFGLGLSALSALVVHAVPATHTGAATGMNANIRTIGGAIGAAVVSAILSANTVPGGIPSETGWALAFGALAVAALLGAAASLLIPEVAAHHDDKP